ncbi:conserved hypothetical protein [Talaromyces stipitatus ATCC 10500]|uniref:NAD-dependent epimerase/dehydratase domain-containing protein n=1 Tax=Talaromyces stipitatus (strain ATCC 10500 / CBS 375.48 / QM 6759 / NRRL 1006) TaxID=441959 RepID=B8MGH5_TALSN|nr:uncharacterized protein TSTA_013930 [Talaromyces stipitatus ATCC 10500]EED16295.1 conserved hypothetical protein [Talaromyces stipitatus ATCC 10500]
MSHNIVITGASGYLGGTLLARWKEANLPPYKNLYALVRTDEQAKAVKELYNAEPVRIDLNDDADIEQAIVSREISVIYYLIDVMDKRKPAAMIRALSKVKQNTGRDDVHFLFTTGAKIFSSHTGLPTNRPLLDTEEEIYELLRTAKGPQPLIVEAGKTNVKIIDDAEALGVRSYIFSPCIVYGKGEGFGNPISIQTVAVIRAAKRTRRIYTVDDSSATWPVCHVYDNTTLYLSILRAILSGQNPRYGKNGFYLAASGLVKWHDLYRALAKRLLEKDVIDDDIITPANDAALEKMSTVLRGDKSFVSAEIGGRCTFTAARGHTIGWKAKYAPEHILEVAGEEVDLVLEHS